MYVPINYLILIATTIYQTIATCIEETKSPRGELIDIGGYNLHLYTMGNIHLTVILDHSLAEIEGYLVIQDIAKIARLCIYDGAGYGWSDNSLFRRSRKQIVKKLDTLLNKTGIEPLYVLMGDYFRSFNVR